MIVIYQWWYMIKVYYQGKFAKLFLQTILDRILLDNIKIFIRQLRRNGRQNNEIEEIVVKNIDNTRREVNEILASVEDIDNRINKYIQLYLDRCSKNNEIGDIIYNISEEEEEEIEVKVMDISRKKPDKTIKVTVYRNKKK